MRKQVLSKAASFASHWESFVGHMYCDDEGYVTLGYGQRYYTHETHRYIMTNVNGAVAGHDSKQIESERIKGAYRDNYLASYYEQFSTLAISEKEARRLLAAYLNTSYDLLLCDIPHLEDCPLMAQVALLDLSYGVGVAGVTRGFPSFTKAFIAQDWVECKKECRRAGEKYRERNAAVEDIFAVLSYDSESILADPDAKAALQKLCDAGYTSDQITEAYEVVCGE